MDDVRHRLTRCFRAVFPEFSPNENGHARVGRADDWDSLTAVTLLAVVQEEFGIELEVDDLESATSFETLLARVNQAIGSSAQRGLYANQ